jgi:hypothetical protein
MTANSESFPCNGRTARWTSVDGSNSRFSPRRVTVIKKQSVEDRNPKAALIESLIAAIAVSALIIAFLGAASTATPVRPGAKLQSFSERPVSTQARDGKF